MLLYTRVYGVLNMYKKVSLPSIALFQSSWSFLVMTLVVGPILHFGGLAFELMLGPLPSNTLSILLFYVPSVMSHVKFSSIIDISRTSMLYVNRLEPFISFLLLVVVFLLFISSTFLTALKYPSIFFVCFNMFYQVNFLPHIFFFFQITWRIDIPNKCLTIIIYASTYYYYYEIVTSNFIFSCQMFFVSYA